MKWIYVVLVNILIECMCLSRNTNVTEEESQNFEEDPYGPLFSSDGYPRPGDIPMLNRKVFRGMRVSIMEHPYVVSIRRHYAHYVTGTLLNRNVIISVAHPVVGVPLIEFSVVVGENYADRGSTALTVVLLVIHENFDPFTLVSDIALFRVFEDLLYRTAVKPVMTLFQNATSYVNKLAFVTGWGRCDMTGRELCLPRSSVYFNNEEFDPMLRTVSFQIKESSIHTYCEGYHRHDTEIKEGMLCMGDAREDNPVSPCLAVPGAPLTVSGVLLGIQSWGFGCGYNHDLPLVYTSIEYYKSWIVDNLLVFASIGKSNMTVLFEATKAAKLYELLKLTRAYVLPAHEHRDDDMQATDLDRTLATLRGDVYDLRDYVNGEKLHQSKRKLYTMIRLMHNRTKKLNRMTPAGSYRYKSPHPFLRPTTYKYDDFNRVALASMMIANHGSTDDYDTLKYFHSEDQDSADYGQARIQVGG